ncbi:NFAT activation molecule 1 isoform X1 [Ochotona princeps]|uniref:NFAT activation molecule 1 isoform X1 n=1 Tax=Ochotona princeps TaxID=9978 RepID=UPI0027152A19|nr:NFAT activation molecule 1 isoform X1 [Ochotona princeps]
MESRSPCPASPFVAAVLLALFPSPWTSRLAGGQWVTHIGPPIMVSLANTPVSLHCRFTYPFTLKLKDFTFRYSYMDLQGRTSSEKPLTCQPVPSKDNQTHILECRVTTRLPNASATGTYYCSVRWAGFAVHGEGTFILVRDSGYQEPPQSPQKALLFSFTGLLTALSVLGTVLLLLLWKKKQMQVPGKRSDARPAGAPKQPVAESVYTALQRRETEVYACIEQEACSSPFSWSPVSQGTSHRTEDDGKFNQVYENL